MSAVAPSEDDTPAIGDYAAIGDCRTLALVSRRGGIDWLCLPHFASPSIFAGLLDRANGGHFTVAPVEPFTVRRRYLPDTNVLETEFATAGGVVRVVDFMPLDPAGPRLLVPEREVVRRIEGVAGEVTVAVEVDARPAYATQRPPWRARGAIGWALGFESYLLLLRSDLALETADRGRVLRGRATYRPGERRALSLSFASEAPAVVPPLGDAVDQRLARTCEWWRAWVARCTYAGRDDALVRRSALALKLLTFSLSGAVVAAGTTSLPERVGGGLNWDYRYCWPRDAVLTINAFVTLGWPGEAQSFLGWLLNATRLSWPRLRVLYDIYGGSNIDERELDHLSGYRGSRPVRIGNEAHDQLQLDVYGAVALAAADYVAAGGRLDSADTKLLGLIARSVSELWREPDAGIWEERGRRRHHTFSKVMCWVALDRLLWLADQELLRIDRERCRRERAAIADTIEAQGFNAEIDSYTAVLDGESLDAALLLMPRLGYVDAAAPRMRATFARIDRELGRDGLVYRSTQFLGPEGPREGAFGICGFWAVDCLVRAGRLDEARRRFERLARTANDVGLMSEEVAPASGELLGNFPQAFTHAGLLSTAMALAEAEAEAEAEIEGRDSGC